MSTVSSSLPGVARAAQSTPAAPPQIAVVGNPNAGKSTLFNGLTGLLQKTANYPGVTVERRTGATKLAHGTATLIDLPGMYSLSAQSLDELISLDVLSGRLHGPPDAVLAVVDATKLYQALFLLSQVAELGLPTVVALTKIDLAQARGIDIDVKGLQAELGVPVVPVVATDSASLPTLRRSLDAVIQSEAAKRDSWWPELRAQAEKLQQTVSGQIPIFEWERAIIDAESAAARRLGDVETELAKARLALGETAPLAAVEARRRYDRIRQVLDAAVQPGTESNRVALIDRVFGNPVVALASLVIVMGVVFQAVFTWATPFMDAIDSGASWLAGRVHEWLPDGAIASLLADGVIAGVGSVVIFLPQILILFAFILFLEDTGFLSRAAFLVDRLMRSAGLSGQSVIPMISSFACAVPGIMATRVIADPRSRLATILAAPFMTCSARLPVYTLLIAAFVPPLAVFGWIQLQGLVLLALYVLGILGGVFTAWVLKRFALRQPSPAIAMELPAFAIPNLRTILVKLIDRAKLFLRRAGTVIFSATLIIWALAYFPHPDSIAEQYNAARAAQTSDEAKRALASAEAAAYLEQSFLGHAGKAVQPAFEPLGWDWRVSAAVIAGFPAREVVIAVLGTVYAVGAEASETELVDRLQAARTPAGDAAFTLPMALGLCVFFAFCLQCVSTIAVMRRETNSWRWPALAWLYMTGLGYLGALLTYQIGTRLWT